MKNKKNIELKIYECLGIKQFQKCVFALEKVIHFKDKGKNINYHIKNYSIDKLEEFKKFLYFNGVIHVRNSIGLIVLLILQILFLNPIVLIYVIPSLIKNIYCVMLQRYNYVRINEVIEIKKKIIENKNLRIAENIKKTNEWQETKKHNIDISLEQIKNLKKFIEGTDDVYLDEKSLEILNMLKYFVKNKQSDKIEIENIYKKGGKNNERR